ncbi:MAG: hypothetical protein K0S12_792 [Bacteroidetes bacterium]|nr:hypothetical protein [Bacteroidota bacterium]
MKAIYTLVIFICAYAAAAQSSVCSVKSGAWSDASTWNCNSVPSQVNNVTISAGHTVNIDASFDCNNIIIATGGALKSDSATLLNVRGNWSNSGSFTAGYGKIAFNGTSAQSVAGNSVTTFYEVEINNASGVTLNQNEKVKYLLTLTQGTLSTNNFKLTLLSDNNMTGSIGPIATGADINGKISVQRYISSNVTGWRFLGSPVRTTIMDWSNDFVTSGFPGSGYPNYYFCSIYGYDETVGGSSVNGYTMPTSVNDSLAAGVGYWCWVGPTPKTIEVTGVPYRFNQTFNVSFTPDAGKNEDGWNMVSNPYPSAIDWDAAGWTKSGIQNAIYIWDPTLDQYSAYINGIGVNGGTNIIPSSQAFWVEATQSNPVLSCDESVKTTLNQTYLKSAPKTAVKLIVTGNQYKDETVICFADGASKNIVPNEDALKLFSDNTLVPSISSVAESLDLVINSVPMSNSEVLVPVKVKVGATGIYTLNCPEGISAPLNSCIFLEDRVTGAFINLKSAASYTFHISDTTKAARFLLHMSKPLIKKAVNATCSYKNNGQAIATLPGMGEMSFEWKDMLGNTLTFRKRTSGTDTLKNLAPGYYYVTATGKNKMCPALTEEIEVNRAPELTLIPVITNNACKNEKNGVINASHAFGGTAPYYYKWSNNTYKPVLKDLTSGVYTLVLIDSQGCTDTTYHVIKTMSPVHADFKITTDTATILEGQPVVFSSQSTGQTSLTWDFGTEVSSLSNPTVSFAVPGTHTIELIANDNQCSSVSQKVIQVKKKPSVTPKDLIDEVMIYHSGENNASVKFNFEEPSESIVSVYSIEGKILNTQTVTAWKNTEVVPLGESHGVYIVSVSSHGNYFQNKIIK